MALTTQDDQNAHTHTKNKQILEKCAYADMQTHTHVQTHANTVETLIKAVRTQYSTCVETPAPVW